MPRLRLLALALVAVLASGCLRYDAIIEVAPDGAVQVSERVALDPEWRRDLGDSLNAADRIIETYVREAKQRGGEAKGFGQDSAFAVFRFPSLAAFARDWPDTADNRLQWDRSVYRRVAGEAGPLDELVLFRMSPPDPTRRLPNQHHPVIGIAVVPPVAPARHNAHRVEGRVHRWVFDEHMSAADSVLIAWPAASP